MKTKLLLGAVLILGLTAGTRAVLGWDGLPVPNAGAPSGTVRTTLESAPEFTGVTDWINSKPLKLADQKGKVVVVHFWTNGCINCIHNYPHYRAWQDKYK